MVMTGLFLDISNYIPSDEEMAVDSALAYLRRRELSEDYKIVPSKANQHNSIADACEAIRKANHRSRA